MQPPESSPHLKVPLRYLSKDLRGNELQRHKLMCKQGKCLSLNSCIDGLPPTNPLFACPSLRFFFTEEAQIEAEMEPFPGVKAPISYGVQPSNKRTFAAQTLPFR